METSIITPCFNSSAYIRETYNSLLYQTSMDWEWLVTDDCSSDNTISILNEISKSDPRVKVFQSEFNSGAATSRNNSISHASGEFIAFIDSDDLWKPDKLEKQLEFMGSDINFSFTAYELIDAKGKSLNKYIDKNQTGFFSYNDMLRKKATLGCSTVILRKSAFDDLMMPLIRTGQDYALWLKILKTGNNAYVLNDILTQYRVLPGSISRNKVKKAKRQWQIYREIEKLDFIPAVINFCFYAYRAVFRK